MANKFGLMELSIKGNINKGKNMVKVVSCGLMIAHIMEIFIKITSVEKVSTVGRTVEFMKVIGKIIKCKEREFLHGLMEENMSDNIQMTKNRVMEFFILKMEEYIKVNGIKVNNMVKEFIRKMILSNRECGKIEKELNGYLKRMSKNKTKILLKVQNRYKINDTLRFYCILNRNNIQLYNKYLLNCL